MSDTYFRLKDLAHAKYLNCGIHYDGKLYHQDAFDRDTAKWKFVKVNDHYGDVQHGGLNRYYIISKAHEKYLVGGQVYDGKAYHQDNSKNLTAQWTIELVTFEDGLSGWKITDLKHKKSLVAGQTFDGHVYHQDAKVPNERNLVALWEIEYVAGPVDSIPDFMLPIRMKRMVSVDIHDDQAVFKEEKKVVAKEHFHNQASFISKKEFVREEIFRNDKCVAVESVLADTSMNTLYGELSIGLNLGKGSRQGQDQSNYKDSSFGFDFGAKGSYTHQYGTVKTERDTTTLTNSSESKVSFTQSTDIPPNTEVNCEFIINYKKVNIPFTIKAEVANFDGTVSIREIKGSWYGQELIDTDVNIVETKK